MIRKMFRVIGGFVACIVFEVLMLPLTLPTFILMCLTVCIAQTRDIEAILNDKSWKTQALRFVNNMKWINKYIEIVEKITGWKC